MFEIAIYSCYIIVYLPAIKDENWSILLFQTLRGTPLATKMIIDNVVDVDILDLVWLEEIASWCQSEN